MTALGRKKWIVKSVRKKIGPYLTHYRNTLDLFIRRWLTQQRENKRIEIVQQFIVRWETCVSAQINV